MSLRHFSTETRVVALLTETHFSLHSFIRIKNFTFYLTNHPDITAHGGTAIMTKKFSNTPSYSRQLHWFHANYSNLYPDKTLYCYNRCCVLPPELTSNPIPLPLLIPITINFIAGGDLKAKHGAAEMQSPPVATIFLTASPLLSTVYDHRDTLPIGPLTRTAIQTSSILLYIRLLTSPPTIEPFSDLFSDHCPFKL